MIKILESIEPDELKRNKILPGLVFLKKMPDWVISSNDAAYHPYSRTILIRNGLDVSKIELVEWILHELTHHIIEITFKKKHYHNIYDKFYNKIRGYKK